MVAKPAPVGPAEAAILDEISPVFSVRSVPAGGTILRVLEGGAGPDLLLIHGRGLAATMWGPWLLPLAEHFRVVAPDLPGFGRSLPGQLRPGGADQAIRYFVEPIAALVDALQMRSPAIVGHSLGGLIAIELALAGADEARAQAIGWPARAASPSAIVAIGSMGVGPDMKYPARAYFLVGPERVARWLGPKIFGRISPLPEEHPWARKLNALDFELASVPGGRPIPTIAFNRLFSVFGDSYNHLDRLGEIDAPALIVWGERDAAFPAPAALLASTRLRRGEVAMFDLGHSPHLEAPDRVLAKVLPFLRANAPASANGQPDDPPASRERLTKLS